MIKDEDGRPLVAKNMRGLCVRRDYDISPDEETDMVEPGNGGMSVASAPEHLMRSLRPPAYGGEDARITVWRLDPAQIPENLAYQPDDDNPNAHHGVIEPAGAMLFEDYELAILETRDLWIEC